MALYLVRHGRARAGPEHLDPDLDELGREQAERVREALLGVGATRIVSSPLRRARQTAEPTATGLGLAVEIVHQVAEVFDPGMDTRARQELLQPLLQGCWSEQSASLRAWRTGVLEELARLDDGTTIVFTHFVAISAALGHAMADDRVALAPIPNASITRLRARRGKFVVDELASVAHLGAMEVTSSRSAG